MNGTYGIHPWRVLWSSYRNLAWVGFEPTTTEFRSEALTDWAIRPWVRLALRVNSVQLPQFHRLFSVKFHFGYRLHQLPIPFRRSVYTLNSVQMLWPTELSGHKFNSHSEPTLYSYPNFIVCSVSGFMSAIAFISRQIPFRRFVYKSVGGCQLVF